MTRQNVSGKFSPLYVLASVAFLLAISGFLALSIGNSLTEGPKRSESLKDIQVEKKQPLMPVGTVTSQGQVISQALTAAPTNPGAGGVDWQEYYTDYSGHIEYYVDSSGVTRCQSYYVDTSGVYRAQANNFEWLNTAPTGNTLNGIHGTGPDNIWAVGDGGTVLHYDGTEWTLVAAKNDFDLHTVRTFGPDSVYAAGNQRTLLHYNGNTWTRLKTDAACETNFEHFFGTDENSLTLLSNEPAEPPLMFRSCGVTEWCKEPILAPLATETGDLRVQQWNAYFNALDGDLGILWFLWETLQDDFILTPSFARWEEGRRDFHRFINIRGLSVSPSGKIWMVSHDAQNRTSQELLLYSWTSATGLIREQNNLPTSIQFNDIYAMDDTNLWVVGEGGAIFHYDGQAWLEQTVSPLPRGRENALSVSNSAGTVAILSIPYLWNQRPCDDVLSDVKSDVQVHLLQNGFQTNLPALNNIKANALALDGADNVYVGGEGLLMKWDGTQWQDLRAVMNHPDLHTVHDAVATNSGDLYVIYTGPAGGNNQDRHLLKWDGTSYTEFAAPIHRGEPFRFDALSRLENDDVTVRASKAAMEPIYSSGLVIGEQEVGRHDDFFLVQGTQLASYFMYPPQDLEADDVVGGPFVWFIGKKHIYSAFRGLPRLAIDLDDDFAKGKEIRSATYDAANNRILLNVTEPGCWPTRSQLFAYEPGSGLWRIETGMNSGVIGVFNTPKMTLIGRDGGILIER